MSVLDVARKDFLDVRRAKLIWFVGALYTFFMFLLVYFGQDGAEQPDVLQVLWSMTGIGALFVPLIALVTAYLAIAGERESGSIKYLLSLPNDRRDVVLGKYLSRAAVVVASIVVAFLVGAVLVGVWYPSLEADVYAGIAALTVVYALTYVAVAIGLSAATASRSRAMGAAIGFFFVTNVLTFIQGFSLIAALRYLLNDLLGLGVGDYPLEFVRSVISPTFSYIYSTTLAFPEGINSVPSDLPWYLQGDVMLAVMLAWLVVPILLGLWRFERTDLG